MTAQRLLTTYPRLVCLVVACGMWSAQVASVHGQEPAETTPEATYTRLAEAKVADAIKLTDEQRAKIAALITARAEAVGKALPQDRPAVIAKSEKELETVLTEEQRTLFAKEIAPPRLRFNFRFQKWSDVLEWYAKQANLSLILDAPPPGTFNYSDSKTYTPVEAMDLLNGVLSTKGYTLIRRGGMLLVVDVQDGIPDGLIPRITPEELDKRGKFELVSVLFPLGGRDAQAVKTEVSSLLSPFGKSVLLPQTKQFLVTDTAGIVRAVSAVIASIPEPSTKPAPKPEYGVFAVKNADTKTAEEILQKMFPGAKIAADLKAEQINAYATAPELAAIKSTIEQMQAQNPPEKKPYLESYPIGDQDPSRVVTNLTLVAPTSRISFDPVERQVVVFAVPLDQAAIKLAVEKMGVKGTGTTSRQMEVYRLSKADPSAAVSLLTSMLPQAKFSIDPQTRRLVAIASPEDHKAIAAILEQIQSTEAGPDTQQLQFYPLEHPLPPTSLSVLNTIAPRSQIVNNVDAKQLQVLASPADQKLIKKTLDELMSGIPAPEKRKVVIYPVTITQRARLNAILPTLTTDFPEVRVINDSEPNEIAIWAKPSQHELLKPLIESLSADVPESVKPLLVSHPYRNADPSTSMAVLRSLVPDAKVSLDPINKTLVAIATPEQHEQIKTSIEKLQPSESGPEIPVLRFYPLEEALPPTVISAFPRLVPRAQVTQDTDGKWLQVIATEPDHRLFKKTLDEHLKDMPAVQKRKLVVYPVTFAQRTRFQTLLPSLMSDFPDIRVVSDGTGPEELAIWAKPSQHVLLKGIVEELKREANVGEKKKLVSYALKFADPQTAMVVIQGQFPGAKINVDMTTNRLLIWAPPTDHESIKQAVEELDGEKASESQDKVSVYPIPEIDPDAALTTLQSVLPKVRFVKDAKARAIIAWAKKSDHVIIAKAVASMRSSADGEMKPHLKVYPAGRINVANVLDVLRQTFPNARLAVDSKTGGLAVMGTAAEQEEIQSAIEQMVSQAIGETGRFVAYRLFKTERDTATGVLAQAVPEARISSGKDPTQLLIWARPADHTMIERIITQLESESAPNKDFELKVYSTKSTGVGNIMQLIGRAVPKAMVSLSSEPNRLVIYALPNDHIAIAKIIKQFDAEHKPETVPEFYDLKTVDVDAASRLISTILQKHGGGAGTTMTFIPNTNQMYVEARPEQHELIRTGLVQMRPADPAFEVFQLETVDTFTAESMIRRMFSTSRTPQPIVEPDNPAQKLYVRGTPEQLTRIRDMLEKMGEHGFASAAKGANRRIRVIPFSGDAGAAINEIQKIWSELRPNEIRVVPPAGGKTNLMLQQKDEKSDSSVKPSPGPAPRKVSPDPSSKKEDDEEEEEDSDDDQLLDDQAESEAVEEKSKSDQAEARKKALAETGDQATDGKQEPGAQPAAPVVVMPRDGTITILSEDPEALDQLDKLLRALSLPTESSGRAFAVYSLKFAGATSVAETVRSSLRLQSGGANSRTGSSAPTVVADERLNAIVVHANRSDRIAIEKLIEALDSSEIPESMGSNRPRRVPVKHGSAYQIEAVLRLVYKAQLTTGGGRKEIPIPAGLSPEIAASLQQMNAANTGPLLTLSVDDVSNSIVIMAPKSLGDQVTKLIEELDQAALNENSQGMTLIPTTRMSSVRAQKILNQILDKTRRQRRP